jgi:hypothetical protein
MLGEQDRQMELGDGLKLQDENFHHLDEQLFAVAILLFGSLSDALNCVKKGRLFFGFN